MIKVLITNGENLRAVTFLKAIAGHEDIEIHVAAVRRFSACFFSRYCKHKVIVADCNKNPGQFINDLVDYTTQNNIDVLIPINSVEVGKVLDNRNLFPETLVIPFVEAGLFHKVNDKWEFAKLMRECGVPIPKTIKVDKISNLENVEISYPAIIKVRKSAGSKGVMRVNNRAQLMEQFKTAVKKHKLAENDLPLIQEYIENGESYSAASFCRDGKVLSVMIYKSIRQYPIEHGTGTARISIHDEVIEKNVKKILEHLKWTGIAQFDIIKKNDKYYFLEMNPRFYTSLSVTVKSGLNYPYYLCNPEAEVPLTYKDGVVCKVSMPDTMVYVKSAFRRILSGRNKNRNHDKHPFYFRAYYDDLDLKDPLPFIPLFLKSLRGKIL